MNEKIPHHEEPTDSKVGATITRDADEEFKDIIKKEFEIPSTHNDAYIEPFLVGRMVFKEIGIDDRHRAPQPSTNRSVTWTPKEDGSGNKVDAVTYGDND